MAAVIAIVGLLVTLVIPRLGPAFDWIATDAAARDVTTAISVARAAAVMQGTRARLHLASDSLRVDREGPAGWEPYARWPGPAHAGVAMSVSNADLVFGPIGIGWGPANTTVVLGRGSHFATITTSRLGRVKRR
ncbi:MAG: pilus assembly FimT family protein [Gemmatimonadales bacterium]